MTVLLVAGMTWYIRKPNITRTEDKNKDIFKLVQKYVKIEGIN